MNSKKRPFKWPIFNRQVHYWGSAICAIPVLIIIITGLFLILRKDIDWIQPPTMTGNGHIPTISFNDILDASKLVPEANISTWNDISKLDIRPKKGIIKVQSTNRWEVQLDHQTADIRHVAYRRSGLIESIHDGTFFHRYVSLGIFLPSAIVLLILWITGMYLFLMKWRYKKNRYQSK